MKLARIVSTPMAFCHIEDQINWLAREGVEITLVSSQGSIPRRVSGSVRRVVIRFLRDPSIIFDLVTLVKLWMLFRREQFDVVHSSTPKAGLLCALAGFMARVPVRIHSFTGQRWVTESGLKRRILMMFDRMIVQFCTVVYADSRSQMEFLLNSGVIKKKQISVIGEGSLGGINIARHSTSLPKTQAQVLDETGIDLNCFKFLYVGRLNRDKGILELVIAFKKLYEQHPNSVLVLVGPREMGSGKLDQWLVDLIESHPAIYEIGFVESPQAWFDACDVQVLPSYREGFGTVVLEAALAGVPTIGTNIYGLRDAIVDGETGELIPVRDAEALHHAMKQFLDDRELVERYGAKARERVIAKFGYEKIASALLQNYHELVYE